MTRPKRWNGFRSILCPVDFSDHSRLALQYAVAVARRGGGRLSVLYAADPILAAAAAAALHDRHVARRSRRELREFIDATISTRDRTPLHLTAYASVGDPADVILETAGKRSADLIVLGTTGLTGADRLVIGSTTLSVLQRTKIPVLAIPRGGAIPFNPLSAPWPGPQIMAAVELTDGVASEVETVGQIAQWFGSSLLLANIVTSVAAPAWLSADLNANERIRIAKAQMQIDALAAIARRYVTTDVQVACGGVADEIAVLAANCRAQLLVTALHDRHRWFGAKRGSIAYHVLSHGVSPVLACPPQWRPR